MRQKVLIVDDEPHIRLLLEQTLEDLEDAGVELFFATNGIEAIETIRAEMPHVILLDVMMPKMNGFEVCEVVKGDPDLRDIYVVLLTAKGQEFDRAHGSMVGADRYMTKPFDPGEVLEKVAEVLDISLD